MATALYNTSFSKNDYHLPRSTVDPPGNIARYLFNFPIIFVIMSSRAYQPIDDSFGDQISGFKPWHNPPGLPWVNQACSDCAIQPDPSRAFNGTWMASTSSPALKGVSITLEFKGVAIWVFFILANANPKATVTNTSCTFNLDGSNAGHFVHTPDTSTSDLIYNATVFSATNLSNVNHTLDILIDDSAPSYTNFDYAIYTAVQGDSVTPGGASPSTSSASTLIDSSLTSFGSTTSNLMSPTLVPTLDSSNQPNNIRPSRMVGPIVGAVLGSLAIIVFLFLFHRSRYPKYQAMHRPPTNSLLDVASSQLPVQDTSFSRSLERGTTGQDPVTPTTSTARVPLLPGVSRRDVREELRGPRQREIDTRLEPAQREMFNLTSGQSMLQQRIESEVPAERVQAMDALRAQISVLRSQLEQLEVERQYEWTMGLSDTRPSAYHTH